MAYEYDIFFSYKHSKHMDMEPWVFDIFVPALKKALYLDLGREITMFVDKNELDPFERDPKILIPKLGWGLGHSRCMVAAWQPSYFSSVWCWNECQSFVKRIDSSSHWSPIFPVVLFNGAHFPDFAKATQWLDLRNCYTPSLRPGSSRFKELHNRITDGARILSDKIERAPEWRSDWISETWFNEEPPEPPASRSFPRLD